MGRTRGAAVLLLGLLVAAACSAGDTEAGVGATTSTSAVAVAPPDPSDPASPSDDGAAPPSPAPGQPAAPPAPGNGGGPAAPPDPAPAEQPQPVPSGGPVGSLAAWYLQPDAAQQILVQVLVQDGAAPQPAVPERVRTVLGQLSGKPVALASAAVAGGARQWTSDELRALADRSSPAPTADRAVLTLLFLRGGFAENERAVGVAVRGDVAAVFAERVTEAAGTLGSRSAVEDAVTMHEVGHLLGLVDLVLDTGRQDPEHPGHSPNEDSVMYYAVESTLLGSILTGGPPRDFDQADLDDLARIRNG